MLDKDACFVEKTISHIVLAAKFTASPMHYSNGSREVYVYFCCDGNYTYRVLVQGRV